MQLRRGPASLEEKAASRRSLPAAALVGKHACGPHASEPHIKAIPARTPRTVDTGRSTRTTAARSRALVTLTDHNPSWHAVDLPPEDDHRFHARTQHGTWRGVAHRSTGQRRERTQQRTRQPPYVHAKEKTCALCASLSVARSNRQRGRIVERKRERDRERGVTRCFGREASERSPSSGGGKQRAGTRERKKKYKAPQLKGKVKRNETIKTKKRAVQQQK